MSNTRLKEWDAKYNPGGRLAREVAVLEGRAFKNSTEAREFISIFTTVGLSVDKLSDAEALEFANEVARQVHLISYKYRRDL